MANETQARAPLATVKERFGDKAKLVDEVAGAVSPRPGESKGDLKKRLARASNGKLLRLLERARGSERGR
jgi:hypothetical protein